MAVSIGTQCQFCRPAAFLPPALSLDCPRDPRLVSSLRSRLLHSRLVVESLKIVLTCIVASIFYGVIHDQFTARICLEYFTVFHPPIFNTQSPTLLALGWGIIATWWVGAILGFLLAIASQTPRRRATNSHRETSSANGRLRRTFWVRRIYPGATRHNCTSRMGCVDTTLGRLPQPYRGLVRAHRVLRRRLYRWACSLHYAIPPARPNAKALRRLSRGSHSIYLAGHPSPCPLVALHPLSSADPAFAFRTARVSPAPLIPLIAPRTAGLRPALSPLSLIAPLPFQ